MSRNVRQKQSFPRVKQTKRRVSDSSSSSLNLSDESDGYSAVEAINDSDEDEEDVEAAEVEHIISKEWRAGHSSSPRPIDDENEDGDDEDDPEDEEEDDVEDDASSWEGFADDQDTTDDPPVTEQEAPVERRVRFDVPDSDGDSTDDDDITGADQDFFPDIFVEQDRLAPSFRRELERDDTDDDDDSGSDQVWDVYGNPDDAVSFMEVGGSDMIFEDFDMTVAMNAVLDDDSTPVATPGTSQDLSTAVSTPVPSPEKDDMSTDECDSDGGDTTEDEEPPAKPIRRKNRQDFDGDVFTNSGSVTTVKSRPGAPRVAPFNLNSYGRKPVVFANPKTHRLMIFTPQRQLDLSPDSFNLSDFAFFDTSTAIAPHSANVMMSGVLASMSSFPSGSSMDTPVTGPEAFFAPVSGLELVDGGESGEDEADDGEVGLNIDDFISFGDGSSGEEDADNADDDEDDDEIAMTPAKGDPASSPATNLFAHFDSNPTYVGAFRKEQANHQLITNGKATRESLAFSNPYFQGTLRGIKNMQGVNTSISPVRKQKQKSRAHIASSPLTSISQKRKNLDPFWLGDNGHKRQRSIPDIPLMKPPCAALPQNK